jgi:hypothetical protein
VTAADLRCRLRELAGESLPLPGCGETPARLRRLLEAGAESLSVAKLAEAHWDAVAILAEAGRQPEPGATYAVWASESPAESSALKSHGSSWLLDGRKSFCSGAGLVDRALITVGDPKALLLDIDLRRQTERLQIDLSQWATGAFLATQTGAVIFTGFQISEENIVGTENFYLSRPGFWNGACGPAACWVGGAAGLVAFAERSKRADCHTLAHLGAMEAALWMMEAALDRTGAEIDRRPDADPMLRALRLRHVVEQGCTDILRRLPRAYGPYPLAMDLEISRRYQELDLYLRQTHAERDLESLGRAVQQSRREQAGSEKAGRPASGV